MKGDGPRAGVRSRSRSLSSSRTISFDVPPQEILTKDSVTVAVDAVVYYKVGE